MMNEVTVYKILIKDLKSDGTCKLRFFLKKSLFVNDSEIN